MHRNFLLAVCLTLSACATSTPQSKPPTKAFLDSALAALCPVVERPAAADYDVWQEWANELLQQYAECAARHAKTVQAWPH
ncbi:hypothetical protein GCM10009094_16010 [Massilia aurea]